MLQETIRDKNFVWDKSTASNLVNFIVKKKCRCWVVFFTYIIKNENNIKSLTIDTNYL